MLWLSPVEGPKAGEIVNCLIIVIGRLKGQGAPQLPFPGLVLKIVKSLIPQETTSGYSLQAPLDVAVILSNNERSTGDLR